MDKTTVLLVDDEEDFLDIMHQRIETWGYAMLTVTNGKDAIETVESKKVDIVIVDYMMPELDGLQTVARLREINKDIPIIMFTAHADFKALEGAEQLRVSAFIPKFSSYSDSQSALKSALSIAEKNLKEGNS